MKTSILTIILCIGIFGLCSAKRTWISEPGDYSFRKSVSLTVEQQGGDDEKITVYTCPMHPEVIQGKSGKCPHCGMNLTSKEVDKLYTCSMHPEVIVMTSGKCSKCGMNLISKPIDQFCICPMHTEIAAFKNGRCPKCGMKGESTETSK